ncbi:glutaredoxin family protein [Deinococcus sp.]|uniref:glutaredoxin family protein n=1 Tax=Deinococcus sp. TaxID=47478 RepID=UPI003C79B37F
MTQPPDAPVAQPSLKVYSTGWCPECRVAKMALDKKGIPYQEINIEEVPDAAEYVMSINGGKRSVPTLQYGEVAASLSGYSVSKLNDFLGKAGLA